MDVTTKLITADDLLAMPMGKHRYELVGVESGGTTEDGMFTVEPCVCLAACGSAPVAIVNRQFYENLTPERMRALIDTIRASGLPEDGPVLNFEPRANAATPTGF